MVIWVCAAVAQQNTYIRLFTDRDIYSSGETVLCKIYLSSQDVSSILHVELINPGGVSISNSNLSVSGGQSDGYIILPDSLSTGSYYLRASVRTSKTAICKEICITNRFAGGNVAGFRPHVSSNQQNVATPLQFHPFEGMKDRYHTGEEVHALLQLPNQLIAQIDGNLCISVADHSLEYPAASFKVEMKTSDNHLPEKDGMILEGVVTDKATNLPCNNALLFLSIPDSIPYFKFYKTGKDGRFYFQLKRYSGKALTVVQLANQQDSRSMKISLFDPEGVKLEIPQMEFQNLPADFQKCIEKNKDALTFRKMFGQADIRIQEMPAPQTEQYPFYGLPSETVEPKLFLDLPNFTEIARELLSGVKFRSFGRTPTMQVLNLPMHSYFTESPLVLLDGVPISDLGLIKELGTKEIEKIEVGQYERFFGSVNFKGFVAIHTVRKDFSGIPSSDDFVKIALNGIQGQPILVENAHQKSGEPDFRQLLLWNPSVPPASAIDLNFKTSDIQGVFKLIVRGKNKDGSIFYNEQLFEVN